MLAYASSTANDISSEAFDHVRARLGEIGAEPSPRAYAAALEALRGRIRAAYGVADDVEIVFAPSGTDLEYVALACIAGKGEGGTHNILLGADEVGSGCIHSAGGDYFAERTALGIATEPGQPIEGLGGVRVEMVDIPVRDDAGRVRPSAEIISRMDQSIAAARQAHRHSLVHGVHGSKTGLILPAIADFDRLKARHGNSLTLVVDACQGRITSQAVRDYLERDMILFVTGSKFIGGPPFSGFALIPASIAAAAPTIPVGLASVFRRSEWPASWPGSEALPDTVNPGLLLRLEAAIFELDRFQSLDIADVTRVILAFHAAIRDEIVDRSPAHRVAPYPPGDRNEADMHPIEMRTLSTLDLSELGGGRFEDAQAWHQALLGHGIRLGQPVKCIRREGGGWGATLRIGLAMWQIAQRVDLSDAALTAAFRSDMARIRDALIAVASCPKTP